MSDFPTSAQDFLLAPASRSEAKALLSLSDEENLRLIAHLEAEAAVEHLKVIGGLTGLSKALRKAAKKSLYALRSKGVRGQDVAFVAKLPWVELEVDLEVAGSVELPGVFGRFLLWTRPMPGATAVHIQGDTFGFIESVELLPRLSRKELLAAHEEIIKSTRDADPLTGELVLGSAHLMVRLIDHLEIMHRLPTGNYSKVRPLGWSSVLLWREQALAAGARPELCQAAAALTLTPDDLETSAGLLGHRASGIALPPMWIVSALVHDLEAHAEKVAKGQHKLTGEAESEAHIEELALAHLDAFAGSEHGRARVAQQMEASADGLYSLGHEREARWALSVSQALRDGVRPRDIPYLAAVFMRLAPNKALEVTQAASSGAPNPPAEPTSTE